MAQEGAADARRLAEPDTPGEKQEDSRKEKREEKDPREASLERLMERMPELLAQIKPMGELTEEERAERLATAKKLQSMTVVARGGQAWTQHRTEPIMTSIVSTCSLPLPLSYPPYDLPTSYVDLSLRVKSPKSTPKNAPQDRPKD